MNVDTVGRKNKHLVYILDKNEFPFRVSFVNRCAENKATGAPLDDQVKVDAGLPAILHLPFRCLSAHLFEL